MNTSTTGPASEGVGQKLWQEQSCEGPRCRSASSLRQAASSPPPPLPPPPPPCRSPQALAALARPPPRPQPPPPQQRLDQQQAQQCHPPSSAFPCTSRLLRSDQQTTVRVHGADQRQTRLQPRKHAEHESSFWAAAWEEVRSLFTLGNVSVDCLSFGTRPGNVRSAKFTEECI